MTRCDGLLKTWFSPWRTKTAEGAPGQSDYGAFFRSDRTPSGRMTFPPAIPSVTTLTLALSKGRIFDETLPLLAAAGIVPAEDPETSRKLILGTNRPGVSVVIVRASDVPTYVQYGAADVGVAGKDVLLEHGGEGLYQPLDLEIARCRMVVATQARLRLGRHGAARRAHPGGDQVRADGARAFRRQGHARRPDQALRLDGARAAGRARRRHRRSRLQRQHAARPTISSRSRRSCRSARGSSSIRRRSS